MRFESFDQIRALDEEQLHDLLRTGDALERLWAAWSLALDLGNQSTRLLDVDAQPNPGVRAHLVVLLASFGQTEALFTLAERDPDAGVRAAACQYLIQIAGEASEPVQAFLEERLGSESEAQPVARILRCLPSSWSPLDLGTLTHLLGHVDAQVRLTAIDYLGRHHPARALPEAELVERLDIEVEPRVLLALTDLLEPESVGRRVLRAAIRVPSSALRLLDVLADRGWRTEWVVLAELARMEDPRIRARCLQLCSRWTGDDALSWLGATALGGWYTPPEHDVRPDETELDRDQAYRETTDGARKTVLSLLEDDDFAEWAPLAPALTAILSEVDEELTWLLREDFDLLDSEGIDAQNEVRRLLASRRRLSTALTPINDPPSNGGS